MKDFHQKLCEKIAQDGGDYRVVLFGDHTWCAWANWFPVEKVINHESIALGSVIRNNWHRENARDAFLITVDRALAFLSVPNRSHSWILKKQIICTLLGMTPKEMQLQRELEERAREGRRRSAQGRRRSPHEWRRRARGGRRSARGRRCARKEEGGGT